MLFHGGRDPLGAHSLIAHLIINSVIAEVVFKSPDNINKTSHPKSVRMSHLDSSTTKGWTQTSDGPFDLC